MPEGGSGRGADREPDVRIVRGEVIDPADASSSATWAGEPGRAGETGAGSSTPPAGEADAGPEAADIRYGTVITPDAWSGSGGYGGYPRMEVRTFAMPRPPGGWIVWLGGGLVALGVYLVLAASYPQVAAAGSAAVAVVGGLLLALGISRRGGWAVYVGAVVLAGGLAGLGQAAGVLPGGGWTTLAIGIALLALGLYRMRRGPGGRTLAFLGAAMAVLGGIQAAGSVIPGFPSLGQLAVPVILAGVGLIVILRAVRRP